MLATLPVLGKQRQADRSLEPISHPGWGSMLSQTARWSASEDWQPRWSSTFHLFSLPIPLSVSVSPSRQKNDTKMNSHSREEPNPKHTPVLTGQARADQTVLDTRECSWHLFNCSTLVEHLLCTRRRVLQVETKSIHSNNWASGRQMELNWQPSKYCKVETADTILTQEGLPILQRNSGRNRPSWVGQVEERRLTSGEPWRTRKLEMSEERQKGENIPRDSIEQLLEGVTMGWDMTGLGSGVKPGVRETHEKDHKGWSLGMSLDFWVGKEEPRATHTREKMKNGSRQGCWPRHNELLRFKSRHACNKQKPPVGLLLPRIIFCLHKHQALRSTCIL